MAISRAWMGMTLASALALTSCEDDPAPAGPDSDSGTPNESGGSTGTGGRQSSGSGGRAAAGASGASAGGASSGGSAGAGNGGTAGAASGGSAGVASGGSAGTGAGGAGGSASGGTAGAGTGGSAGAAGDAGVGGTDSGADASTAKRGRFRATGDMLVGRKDHTATALADGRVLVVGGYDGTVISSAEIFDAAAAAGVGAFTATGSLGTPRTWHTATRLQNGKVLIAGGVSGAGSTYVKSAEIFDPAANGGVGAFTPTGDMVEIRAIHLAALLPSGKVLIVGGQKAIGSANYLTTAEIFDPAANAGSGAFTSTGASAFAGRAGDELAVLTGGKVLVAGGLNTIAVTTAQLFDPAAASGVGSFTATGSLTTGRVNHTVTALAGGKAIVIGGTDLSFNTNTTEIFDPAAAAGAGAFTAGPSMTYRREAHTATTLTDGVILIAGGSQDSALYPTGEVYDPALNGGAGGFVVTGDLVTTRDLHAAAPLSGGRALLTGGSTQGDFAMKKAEVYEP